MTQMNDIRESKFVFSDKSPSKMNKIQKEKNLVKLYIGSTLNFALDTKAKTFCNSCYNTSE